jgi:hypothetical protein
MFVPLPENTPDTVFQLTFSAGPTVAAIATDYILPPEQLAQEVPTVRRSSSVTQHIINIGPGAAKVCALQQRVGYDLFQLMCECMTTFVLLLS